MKTIKAQGYRPLRKDEVSSASELFRYLKRNRSSASKIFHYTTFDSLIAIFKNKSFRLTRFDLMNDKAEQKLVNGIKTELNYIMSVCTDETEYVSMWAIYGKASGIKIRIDFTSKSLEDLSEEDNSYYSNSENRIVLNKDGGFRSSNLSIQISDVVYLNKNKNEIRHNTNPFPNLKYDAKLGEQLSGFLKYDAWEFEKERRLKVTINDIDIVGSPQHIYLKLTNEFLSGISVTYNPWISPDLQKELSIALNRVAGRKVDQISSSNYGEIGEL